MPAGDASAAIRRKIEAAGGELTEHGDVAIERSAGREIQSPGALVDRDQTLEAKEPDQRMPSPASKRPVRLVLAAQKLGKIGRRECIAGGVGTALHVDAEGAGVALDPERAVPPLLPALVPGLTVKDAMSFAGARRDGFAAQLVGRAWRELVHHRRDAVERAGIEIEREGAARMRRPGTDLAFHGQVAPPRSPTDSR